MFQKHLKKEIFFSSIGHFNILKTFFFLNTLAVIYYTLLAMGWLCLLRYCKTESGDYKNLSVLLIIFVLPPNLTSRQHRKWPELFKITAMVFVRPSRHQKTCQWEAEGTWKRKESLWAGTPECLYHTMPSLMSCWVKVLVGVAVLPSGRCCPSSAGLSAGISTRRTTSPRKATQLVRISGKSKSKSELSSSCLLSFFF